MKSALKLIIPLLLFACACEKMESSISVSETEIEAQYTGGEISISFQVDEEWKAYVRYDTPGENGWIETPAVSGKKGQQDFVIRLKENPNRRRKATISITAGTKSTRSTTISVWQDGEIDRDMTSALDVGLAAYWLTMHPNWGRITNEDILSCQHLIFDNIWPDMGFGGLSLFKNLTTISVRNCALQKLDFRDVSWLKTLYIEDCQLQVLELSGNPELESLQINNVASLRSLDTSQNPRLSTVAFTHTLTPCEMERVILGPGVQTFYIENTPSLSEIDCTQAECLEWLFFPNCNVRRLDLSKTKVRHLEVRQNPLDELLLSPTLEVLSINMCTGNLSTLTLGANVRKLVVTCTTLSELNVDAAQPLTWLECPSNQLSRVDISRISLPEYLSFGGNPGIDGVFELIVAPKDFETAKELYDGWSWVNEAYDVIVTKVISAN